MLSITNFLAYKVCDRGNSVAINSTARMCTNVLPWVDLAIGIILCTLGAVLAHYNIIPTQAQTILYGIGGAQIIAGPLMRIARCWTHLSTVSYNNARKHSATDNLKYVFCCCCRNCCPTPGNFDD